MELPARLERLVLQTAISELRSRPAPPAEGIEQLLPRFDAATPGDHPGDLAGLIAFNNAHADLELPHFGQEIFEQAEATSGDLADPEYLELRATATDGAREAIDTVRASHDLDAIVAPTNSPAWPTDLVSGDAFLFGSSGFAAVAGYPLVSVTAGFAFGLPIGITFMASAWSEPTLIRLASGFEAARGGIRRPRFKRSLNLDQLLPEKHTPQKCTLEPHRKLRLLRERRKGYVPPG